MIPKIIHYCWFGHNPLPELAKKCIASWKNYFPDYEIKEWNESNFDVNAIPYTEEAYKQKKYAFVSDYARFWILYHYGGLYFDTDVEVIKPMNEIIEKGPFMGCENTAKKRNKVGDSSGLELGVNPGLGIGTTARLEFYKEILDKYSTMHFLLPNGLMNQVTVVEYTTQLLCLKGLKSSNEVQQVAGIWVYPKEYFCPKDYTTGKVTITQNTVSIHHYSETWFPWYMKLEGKLWQYLGFGKQFWITRVIYKIQRIFS